MLHGIGWDPQGLPPRAEDPACPDTGGPVTPTETGAYLADVDFWKVSLAEDGHLCLGATTDSEDVGWDLVAWQLDSCGLPIAPWASETTVLGSSLGGVADSWGAPAGAGDLAVGFAAYYPDDEGRDVHYTLSVALVRDEACPAPPELQLP